MTTTTIQIGSRVRSFDFEGRDLTGDRACYVEGTVTGIGRFDFPDCDRYQIAVDKIIFGGEEQSPETGQEAYPPVNGTRRMMGGLTDGVELI